ncbi:MAG TPA: SDR family NAD(P)-dependent oxidoreductase [Myxococcota bacterium]|nr:SDR family NAD(P)-dependent oxidoreductase [Myxococcota bacterium]
MGERLCVVTGVGPGTGAALARRFAADDYRVALLARDATRLEKLAAELPGSGAFPVDVANLDALRATLGRVRAQLGAPSVLLHNAVAGGLGSFESVAPEALEQRFRVNVTSLLVLAQELAPAMVAAGSGAIVVTGNTSAWRGKAEFAGFAPTKAAQRILAQSLARALGPKGVHVAYVVIDAVIDVPWTRQAFRDRPDAFFVRPDAIADAVHHVVHQESSAWTFELDLRPSGESW